MQNELRQGKARVKGVDMKKNRCLLLDKLLGGVGLCSS